MFAMLPSVPSSRKSGTFFLVATIVVLFFVLYAIPSVWSQEDSTQQEQVQQADLERAKEERRRVLEAEIERLRKEAEEYDEEAQKYNREGDTYQHQVSRLNSEISVIQSQIKQYELLLDQTTQEIERNQDTIAFLENKRQHHARILADLLFEYYIIQEQSFLEIVLLYDSFSDFFDAVQHRVSLQESLNEALREVERLEKEIEEEQTELSVKMDEQVLVLGTQSAQQDALGAKRREQQNLLNTARRNEQAAEDEASRARKTIGQILNQIYTLESAGVVTSFGDAYELAKLAERITGVRPAFLLALLKTESSWGRNLGSCYLVDPSTGVGKTKNGAPRSRVMNPTRDVPPFLKITEELGRDPYNTLVSCPHPEYGWGGAMGPAQFIASTWMGQKEELQQILGRPGDPWNVQDAFIASANKLRKYGAVTRNEDAEWKAAMVYYAGGGWNNPTYAPYGNRIIQLARQYQADIDILEGG